MSRLDFRVLGPLEVCRDGSPVTVPSGRRRRVLAALLTSAGRPVTVDALVEAGWAEDLPDDPGSALHTVVSRLRGLLGAEAVRAEPSGYRLAIPAEAVDARRFEQLCVEAAGAAPRQAADLLDSALELWRGSAYAEFADREFARTEARRLELLRSDALEARARVALDYGRPGDAVRHLEVLLGEDPFDERAVELLMTALLRAGRRPEALTRYREHRRRMLDELGLEPAPALRRLEERIISPAPLAQAGPRRQAAPVWIDTSTAFLGREEDAATLQRAVAENRLVTVVGPGGVGKTRLVAELLPTLCHLTGLPAVVVELAPLGPTEVGPAVAAAFGLGDRSREDTALVAELRTSAGLLVLDNCEHLLDQVAGLCNLLVRRCPSLRVLVTSRRRTGLPAERVVTLEPLTVPHPSVPAGSARQTPAVRLVLDRVDRLGEELPVGDLTALADICRRLEGLPLALELAAARIATLGASAVQERLAGDLTLLEEPPSRGRSIGEVVRWSHALLDPGPQQVFEAVSVFPDRFDLTAAAGLFDAWGADIGQDMAAALTELVESSLVSVRVLAGHTSYRILAPIRAEAARLLTASGLEADVRRAHVGWVAELAERSAAECTGPGAASALARMDRCRLDLDQALDWALGQDDLAAATRIAVGVKMCPHWAAGPALGHLVVQVGERGRQSALPEATAGLAAAAAALADLGDVRRSLELADLARKAAAGPATRYLATKAAAIARLYGGDHDGSGRCWQQIVEMDGLPLALTAEAHISLALIGRYAGEHGAAREQSRLGLLLAETSGATPVHAFALYAAGETADGPAERVTLLTAAAEMAESAGAAHVGQVANVALLAELVRAGRHGDAAALAGGLLEGLRRAGAWPQLWTAMRVMAELQSQLDQPHEAALLLSVAETDPTAPSVAGEDIDRYDQLLGEVRSRIGASTHDRIREAAAAVTREQLVERALGTAHALVGSAAR